MERFRRRSNVLEIAEDTSRGEAIIVGEKSKSRSVAAGQ
jgi:hypothetical protein